MSQPISAISDRRKGPSRSLSKEDFWRRTLREHAAGGLSVRAFCRQRGLSEPSFYGWRRTLAQRDRRSARGAGLPGSGFVELRPQAGPGPVPGNAPLEIVWGHLRLVIRSGCDRALLRDVLELLDLRAARPNGQGEA